MEEKKHTHRNYINNTLISLLFTLSATRMKDIMSKKFEINNKNQNIKQIELITLVKNRSAAASLPPSAGTKL